MACLIVTEGEQKDKYYQLGNRTLAGGRDPAREIQIVDETVSRKHFLIHKEGAAHVIVEARAKNGLYINGQACSEHVLQDGDVIRVGKTELTYYLEDRPDRSNALEQYRVGDRACREDRTLSE